MWWLRGGTPDWPVACTRHTVCHPLGQKKFTHSHIHHLSDRNAHLTFTPMHTPVTPIILQHSYTCTDTNTHHSDTQAHILIHTLLLTPLFGERLYGGSCSEKKNTHTHTHGEYCILKQLMLVGENCGTFRSCDAVSSVTHYSPQGVNTGPVSLCLQ